MDIARYNLGAIGIFRENLTLCRENSIVKMTTKHSR